MHFSRPEVLRKQDAGPGSTGLHPVPSVPDSASRFREKREG